MHIDLKLVYNYYKIFSYMTAYFSKSEIFTSKTMKQVVQ